MRQVSVAAVDGVQMTVKVACWTALRVLGEAQSLLLSRGHSRTNRTQPRDSAEKHVVALMARLLLWMMENQGTAN